MKEIHDVTRKRHRDRTDREARVHLPAPPLEAFAKSDIVTLCVGRDARDVRRRLWSKKIGWLIMKA
mgnify:CR=1 FL=1